MRTSADEPMPTLAKTPDHDMFCVDRAFLPRNFRSTPPLQDRLTRIYQEARRRAMAASAAASAAAEQSRVESTS